jgi:hypothetical protein
MEDKPQEKPRTPISTPVTKDVHSLQDLRVQALLKQQQQQQQEDLSEQSPSKPKPSIEIPNSIPQRKPRASVSSIDKTSRNAESPNNISIGSLPVLPSVPVRKNSNKRSNTQSNTSQQTQNPDDPLVSRSMDVFPREIFINPEYRTLLDAATRHIRLLSNHKKKQETANGNFNWEFRYTFSSRLSLS